jgi:hypothetical protein
MAENFTRVQRWDIDGTLVEDYTVPKPLTVYNRDVLLERALAALSSNKTFMDTPNGSLTQADALNQIKAQARQINALIRLLVLDALDDITDA